MELRTRVTAILVLLGPLLVTCTGSVVETSATSTTGSGGAATTAATSPTMQATGSTGGSSTSSTATSASVATSTTASTSAVSSTSTGSTTSPCGAPGCTTNQLCVVPKCQMVTGELCVAGAPDAGAGCPPGTKRAPQFDLDCSEPGFACVGDCPPPAPFCVDLPAGCGGAATCGCLASDPCEPSNSGACRDEDIADGVLSCSLQP